MLRYIPLHRLSPAETERFWVKVNKTPECWEWTASLDPIGYGRLKIGGAIFKAHRLSYFIAHNVDPGEKMVCHTCDNPKCVNPDHLWLGTNQQNQKDSIAKGRHKPIAPAPRAKLTAEQVEKVREMIRSGATNKAIGRVFGVTHQLISRIRRGRAWGGAPMQEPYASLKRHG